jgi:hypothetical protein
MESNKPVDSEGLAASGYFYVSEGPLFSVRYFRSGSLASVQF